MTRARAKALQHQVNSIYMWFQYSFGWYTISSDYNMHHQVLAPRPPPTGPRHRARRQTPRIRRSSSRSTRISIPGRISGHPSERIKIESLEGVNRFLQILIFFSQVLGYADNKCEPNN
jgi:hypothetical protein